ncbi:VanZ family protein [Piscibacillus sp. B03]|uniref:VanZ family protein n=1 Tax=Piscibacillus sp. B03 TaxID=3457430 RepID=UPI003FCCED69
MKKLVTSILFSQIIFIILFPTWLELMDYLHAVVIGVAWVCVTALGLFAGLLWSHKKITIPVNVLHLGIVIYTAGLITLLFFRPNGPGADNINMMPFETIQLYLSGNAEPLVALYNIGANIALTAPLGIYYRLIAKSPNLLTLILIAVTSISIIETLQLILERGSMDIDDLILNTTGFIIGYLVTPIIQKTINLTRM